MLRDPLRTLPTIRRLRDLAGALGIAHELCRRERWSRLELEAFQRRRLSALVRYAIEHSRFYRDLYGSVPPSGAIDLEELPIVSKTLMMDNFDQVVTDPRLHLEELDRHVAELGADDLYLGEYRVLGTSGSTGGRALFVYDRREWSTSLAGFLRYVTLLERPPRLPRLKLAAIGGPSPLHQSNRVAGSLDVGAYRMLRLPVTASVGDLVGVLNAFQPDVLSVYPSMAALLADEQRQGRLNIRPGTISTSGEMRTDEMRRKIRAAWGVEPFNLYAASETGVLAVDCSHHRGLHLFEDLSIVEIVDEAGGPVPSGSAGHKLLVTNLFNSTQPLIRYEISDMLTMSLEQCPCRRPFRLINRIEGRNDDILYLLDQDGKRIPVHPAHLHAPLEASAEVRQYQIVHDAARIHVRVVLVNGASSEQVCARVRASYLAALAALGVQPLRIDVEAVSAIERESGPAAKFKLVKSAVPRDL